MPCRHHIWAVVVLLAGCASLFDRKNDFERGLNAYHNNQFRTAANYFNAYHSEHPDSDSTLYYLYDCYKRLDEQAQQINTLEKLADRRVNDLNIYLNLLYLYQKFGRYVPQYRMLLNIPQSVSSALDQRIVLSRRLLAELICGAIDARIETDALVFCISKNYLPLFPDGRLYEDDTLTVANLIVLLDRLVEPLYPRNIFPMKNVSTRSYLYLPYMRLVDLGVMDFSPYLSPDEKASVLATVRALKVLVAGGHID